MYALTLTLFVLLFAVPARAQVTIDIGIHLPAPPPLIVVPEVRAVQYVPSAPTNLFVFGGQYWAFTNGAWYVSGGHQGPWIVVAPQFVPRPVLLVPVRYYHVPPGHWKQWDHKRPPRWDDDWGREWSEKRAWKHRDRDDDDDDRGKGRGRGHGRDR